MPFFSATATAKELRQRAEELYYFKNYQNLRFGKNVFNGINALINALHTKSSALEKIQLLFDIKNPELHHQYPLFIAGLCNFYIKTLNKEQLNQYANLLFSSMLKCYAILLTQIHHPDFEPLVLHEMNQAAQRFAHDYKYHAVPLLQTNPQNEAERLSVGIVAKALLSQDEQEEASFYQSTITTKFSHLLETSPSKFSRFILEHLRKEIEPLLPPKEGPRAPQVYSHNPYKPVI